LQQQNIGLKVQYLKQFQSIYWCMNGKTATTVVGQSSSDAAGQPSADASEDVSVSGHFVP